MPRQSKPRKKTQSLSDNDITALRKKYNIDNWQDESKYEYVKKLTRPQLKWEFLRRDKGYRHRFERVGKPAISPLWGEYFDPAKRGDEIPKDYVFKSVLRRGGPLMLEPPRLDKLMLKPKEIANRRDDANTYGYMGWQLMELCESGYLVLIFDPAFPGKDQFKEARKHFEEVRNELDDESKVGRQIVLSDAAKLLRILDAHNEGVSYEKIGVDFYFAHKDDHSDAAARGWQHVKRAQSYAWKL